MKSRLGGLLLLIAPLVLLSQSANQDWNKVTALPGVEMKGLNTRQKAAALKMLRQAGCSCGCDMKLAECRMNDPNCSYSTNLAALVVEAVKGGKSESETLALLKASPWSHVQEAKLLDDPIEISIYGAPSRGPQNAPITLVEFSDFQCPYCAVAIGQFELLI